jgi:hypothetical protein
MLEDFRTLYADPGEDFGWSMGCGTVLLAAGTEKMWTMADDVWAALNDPSDPSLMLNDTSFAREGVDRALFSLPIQRIVCEDFRIYPWKVKDLKFDRVRTARVIGALTFMCRLLDIPFVLQGANIKKAAQAAGAEELYYKPLHENRHQNDAIQHFVFFTSVELLGLPLPVPKDSDE